MGKAMPDLEQPKDRGKTWACFPFSQPGLHERAEEIICHNFFAFCGSEKKGTLKGGLIRDIGAQGLDKRLLSFFLSSVPSQSCLVLIKTCPTRGLTDLGVIPPTPHPIA